MGVLCVFVKRLQSLEENLKAPTFPIIVFVDFETRFQWDLYILRVIWKPSVLLCWQNISHNITKIIYRRMWFDLKFVTSWAVVAQKRKYHREKYTMSRILLYCATLLILALIASEILIQVDSIEVARKRIGSSSSKSSTSSSSSR